MAHFKLLFSAATATLTSGLWFLGCTTEVNSPSNTGAGGSSGASTGVGGSGVTGMGGSSVGGSGVTGMGGSGVGGGGVTGMGGSSAGGSGVSGMGGGSGIGGDMGTGGDASGTGGAGLGGSGMGGSDAGAGGSGAGMGGSGTGGSAADDPNSGPNTMGWIGCSMGENAAAGYRRIGGTRMWGGYGNGGAVVQQWTSNSSAGWQRFDQQAAQNGEPVAVWIMICIFAQAGATAQEVNAMIENARSHSAPGAVIYLTGQPLYEPGHTCTLAGADGPESTDSLAQQVAAQHDDVIYPGSFLLRAGEVSGDTCHANAQGEDSLGEQARAFWGQP